MTPPHPRLSHAALSATLLCACMPTLPPSAADSGAASAVDQDDIDSADPCALAPSWDSEIHGLLLTHCAGCHAALTPNRYGAPASVSFDTEDEARQWADRIEVRVLDQADMPPGGGLSPDELSDVDAWLSCP